jgi:chaperone required for assembly of F1-ATPase
VKRFYQDVGVEATERGHRILLDGRPVHSPARRLLSMPSAALAEAVADEWRAQGETIERAGMGLTRLVSTALDRMPALRDAAIDEVLGYALTDLLCYRAAAPAELAARQERAWQPWLDWLARAHGARLVVTTSMLPVSQPEPALARLRAAIEQLDDWRLVGLHGATTALGSEVLALALLDGEIDAEEALAASLLDELFEIERWGRERDAERRQQVVRRDVAAAATFLACLRPSATAALLRPDSGE